MRFLSLDFETSGLDSRRHFPVSLAVALMDGEEVVDSREWTIKPPQKDGKVTREYDVFALKISGKTLAQLDAGSTASACLKELSEWASDKDRPGGSLCAYPVVAFNAPFDFAFYSELLFAAGSWNQHLRAFESFTPPLYGPWHCARLLAMNRIKLARYSLDSVCEHFGLSRSSEVHGAAEDAILAEKVFARLGVPA